MRFISSFSVLIGMLIAYNISIIADNSEFVSLNDPKVLAIEVKDDNDPLIDLRKQTIIQYNIIQGGSRYYDEHDTKIRKGLYNRLIEAQKMLPKDVYLYIVNGHRSLDTQSKFFKDGLDFIKKHHPDWSEDKIWQYVSKYITPVKFLDGSKSHPPHCTGGAVAVVLADQNGKFLDMGDKFNDWDDEKKWSEANLDKLMTNSKAISVEAQHNRELMSKVLSNAGLVNYPLFYWHWSYGDRYWAYMTHHKYAIYGTVEK